MEEGADKRMDGALIGWERERMDGGVKEWTEECERMDGGVRERMEV